MTQATQAALESILARQAQAAGIELGRSFADKMPTAADLSRAWRYWRERGKGTAAASLMALEDARNGRDRWPSAGLASYSNAPGKDGGRWMEDTKAAGLRFVGFADEIARKAGSRADCYGYYTDSDGDGETLRGCVFQLPTPADGLARYVPGYREGESGRDGWRDTSTGRDGGAAVVYLDSVMRGDTPGGDSYNCNAAEDAWQSELRAAFNEGKACV